MRSLVARLNAVGDREAERADVIGDDTEGDVDLLLLARRICLPVLGSVERVTLAAELLDLVEDRPENVGLVVGDRAFAKSDTFVPWMRP